jgi:hypothetical protein
MAYKPKVLTVSEGGHGVASHTAYTPLCGGTTGTGNFQSVASLGNSGDVLTSNGAGALPTFQAPTAGGLGYVISISATSGSPSDAATYAITASGSNSNYSGTATGRQRFYVPFSGTITKYVGAFTVTGTLGSAQNVTLDLYKNDVSQVTIATFTLDATPVSTTNTGLSVSVTAGDYITLVMNCPTWTTNPTNVTSYGAIYIT